MTDDRPDRDAGDASRHDGPASAGDGGPDPAAIPRGNLVSARTVGDIAEPLWTALDRELTGYLVIEPARSILLDDRSRAVVTFSDGVPVLAYETSGDVGGPDALAAVAEETPARAELYRLADDTLAPFHERRDCRVAPDAPALELAADHALADRTRAAAPARDDPAGESAAAAFLDDEDRVAAIRADARAQARERAEEWGLTDQLVDDSGTE
ncbi:MAG: hypothetical protein ABEI75_02470 [Halobaculum sp.]